MYSIAAVLSFSDFVIYNAGSASLFQSVDSKFSRGSQFIPGIYTFLSLYAVGVTTYGNNALYVYVVPKVSVHVVGTGDKPIWWHV